MNSDNEFCEYSGLLDLLSYERANNYDEWLYVGLSLFRLGNGSNEAFKLWERFSQKYRKEECEKQWNKMKKFKDEHVVLQKSTGRALFMYLAEEDSPKAFEKLKKRFT